MERGGFAVDLDQDLIVAAFERDVITEVSGGETSAFDVHVEDGKLGPLAHGAYAVADFNAGMHDRFAILFEEDDHVAIGVRGAVDGYRFGPAVADHHSAGASEGLEVPDHECDGVLARHTLPADDLGEGVVRYEQRGKGNCQRRDEGRSSGRIVSQQKTPL